MKMQIQITMDNDAFSCGQGAEAARILRDLAKQIEGQDTFPLGVVASHLRDVNGNVVGNAKVTK